MRKVKLLIPHTSQRGNFYPRGEYEENQLPPEILKSNYISIEFEEQNVVDIGKENIVEIKKETRLQAENKGLVESPKVEERVEKVVAERIEERTPIIEKVNHNPKQELPPSTTNTYEAVLDKELDKEVTVPERNNRRITRIL